MTKTLHTVRVALALCVLSACMDADVTRSTDAPSRAPIADPIGPLANPATVDAAIGTCYARTVSPALIETVTEQVIIPEVLNEDGSVVSPASFRTDTRQEILRERREIEFETPCDNILTPPFVASVQRALIARGYYRGPVSGEIDHRTSDAIRRFQVDQDDVHTATLTLKTARNLGLIAVPRDSL